MRLLVIAATGCRAILGIDTPGAGGDGTDARTGGPTAVQTGFATRPDGTLLQVALGKPVTRGDVLVVAVGADSQISPAITDTLGNKYDELAPPDARGSVSASLAFVPSSAAGLDTIEVTLATDAPFPDVRVVEYAGLAADPLDENATCTGSDTMPTCPVSTRCPGELVVAAMYSAAFAHAGDPAFTLRVDTDLKNLLEDRIESDPGGYSATATLDGAGDWIMQIASLRPR